MGNSAFQVSNGVGVPTGGTTGQVLAKNSGSDYDTEWVDPAAGSGTNLAATLSSTNTVITSDTGTDATIPAVDATNAGVMTPTMKTKLDGITTGATANSSDATLLNRANHTGTQLLATISDVTASSAEVNVLDGVTASTAELNLLDGVTATTAELNYTAGVTSAIQTQLNAKASLTGSETLTNKELTTPKIAQINDSNGNPYLAVSATASAVSYLTITNAASGGTITLAATASAGTPNFVLKGSGTFALRPTSNGTNAIRLQNADGTSNILVADTSNARIAIGGTTPTSVLDVRGAIGLPLSSKTGAYTATATDSTLLGDTTGGAFSITLPSAASITGRVYTIKRTSAGSNNLTVATTSSQTIDGSTTYVLGSQYKYVTVQSDGSNWVIIANN
jgi:hypothetical protein